MSLTQAHLQHLAHTNKKKLPKGELGCFTIIRNDEQKLKTKLNKMS